MGERGADLLLVLVVDEDDVVKQGNTYRQTLLRRRGYSSPRPAQSSYVGRPKASQSSGRTILRPTFANNCTANNPRAMNCRRSSYHPYPQR